MDQVLFNAKAYLGRGKFAQAVLIRGEHIVLTGTNDEILAAAGAGARLMDTGGRLLLPGFHDSHLHLSHFGRELSDIAAAGVSSIGELIRRGRETIKRLTLRPGAVVTGRGWDQEQFTDEKRLPTRYDLDRISAEHAVILSRKCGHIVCCNTRALQMAGIFRPVPMVAGGQIDVDEAGEPTGILRENAMDLALRIVPEPDAGQTEAQLAYAMRHALENGLTAVASQDVTGGDIDSFIGAYKKLYGKGLRLRVTQQAGIGCMEHLDEYIRRGYRTGTTLHAPYLKMGPLKLFADGSLGSRTALLRKPYSDAPETKDTRAGQERDGRLYRKGRGKRYAGGGARHWRRRDGYRPLLF